MEPHRVIQRSHQRDAAIERIEAVREEGGAQQAIVALVGGHALVRAGIVAKRPDGLHPDELARLLHLGRPQRVGLLAVPDLDRQDLAETILSERAKNGIRNGYIREPKLEPVSQLSIEARILEQILEAVRIALQHLGRRRRGHWRLKDFCQRRTNKIDRRRTWCSR